MPKAAKVKAAPQLRCSICSEMVTPDTYAVHIQTKHAPQPGATTATSMSQPIPTAPPTSSWSQPSPNGANLQPMTGPLKTSELAGGQYLKGTDVPEGTNTIEFRIVQFVRDPQGRSKLTARISETLGKSLFGFNTTNIRSVAALGYEDMQLLVGKKIVCMIGMQPNPQQAGRPTKALFVSRVEA